MKRIISFILALIVLSSIVPFSVIADSVEESNTKSEVSNIGTETSAAEDEYIYYSDLFYGYSYYLTNANPYLSLLNNYTLECNTMVLNEYVKTGHFILSAGSEGFDVATSPDAFAKEVLDNVGLTSFRYNDELDAANLIFVTELMEVNLTFKEASSEIGTENKVLKNLNSFLKNLQKIDEISLEAEAFYSPGKNEAEVYYSVFEQSLAYYKDYFTQISPKLPSFKTQLHTTLAEITPTLGAIGEAADFTKKMLIALMLQEAELELINDILATQPTSSDLYKGLSRLKTQLENGIVNYYAVDFVADKVYDEVIGEVSSLVNKLIMGQWESYYSLVTGVVKLMNAVVLKWILKADYSEYTTNAMLRKYTMDLYDGLKNKSKVFSTQFNNSEIDKYQRIFESYIAMSKASIKSCKKLAKHNPTGSEYDENFCDKMLGVVEGLGDYQDYIYSTKVTIKNIDPSNRVVTDFGSWSLSSGNTLSGPSDKIVNGYIYCPLGGLNADIRKDYSQTLYYATYSKIVINGDLKIYQTRGTAATINETTTLIINGDFYYYKDTGSGLSGTSSDFYNFGNFHVNGSAKIVGGYSYYFGGFKYANFYNYGSLNVKENLNLDMITGEFVNNGTVNIGNELGIYNRGKLQNNGIINVDIVMLESYENSSPYQYSDLFMSDDAFLYIRSHITLDYYLNEACIGGTIVFCGEEVQEISGLIAKNIIVTNPKGIKYLSSVEVYGYYWLNGNPLDNGDFITYIYSQTPFDTISDYKKVTVRDVCLILNGDFKGDIRFNNGLNVISEDSINIYGNVTIAGGEFSISSSKVVIVNGDLRLTGNSKINNYGTLQVTGNLNNYYSTTNTNNYPKIFNYSTLIVNGNLDSDDRTYDSKTRGYMYQTSSNAKLILGGNLEFYSRDYCNISNGSIIFNGTGLQRALYLNAATIILENGSDEGVEFTSSITPSVLFDHKGNNFALYNNGTGSTFVDYDGDGLKDNVDPEPIVGNSCVLSFESENTEKGLVSTDKVETVGGTSITVTATPTFKYEFVKWVNSVGTTMSTSAQWTFIAKSKDETYTAIFSKRQQPITTQCDGGMIDVATMAEIESEVHVTITEDEGYVYTEGSLSYNGNPIENGVFVMPDEPVVITAEFVRNENYFLLDDMITTAKGYTYESYSKESFDALTDAIANAEEALVNHITEVDSNNHIQTLQFAIAALEDRYITNLAFDYSPMLFVNVPDMINDATVIVTYDNGTTEIVSATECTIKDYDCSKVGEQNITIEYGGSAATETVLVEKRWLWDCDILGIEDQIYDGVKIEYTLPDLELTYWWTYEQLEKGVDYIVEYENNTALGQATVTITGIGDYQDSINFYYEIYCIHDFDVDTTVESTCSQEGWYTEKCQICGVTDKEITVTTGLPESSHNYTNNLDKSYYYTYEMADSLTLKFSSSTYTESNWDYIYIYDGSNNLIGKYTGSQLAAKNIFVTGDTVRIRLTSDSSTVKYGFSLTSIVVKTSKIIIPKLEHTEGDWATVDEASCDSYGTEELKCVVCGEVLDVRRIPLLAEHSFGDWQIYIEAKFHTDGEERKYCSTCDYYESRVIPKLSESHVCAFTGKEEVVNNPTCTERGSKNVYCYASECGNYIAVDIEAGGHTEGEWIVVSEATCTDDGFVELRCASCDEVMNSEIIEATDHALGNWYVYIEAKFNTDGEERQECSECDYYESRIIPKLSQSHVCAFTGTEEVVINATCTEDGSKNVYCYESECKKFETKAIESKGHTEGKWTITKSVTCTENGTKEQRCTVCNELLATETISFTGHQYGAWITIKEPTTKEPGEKSRECTVCHESETQRIDPITIEGILGDANGDGVVNIKDATVIQKHIANLITLTDDGYAVADVDGSETVNIKDATAIQKHLAGIHTGYSIGEPAVLKKN